ncbi:MAG: short chain dehydrogenase [Gemmatimonadota bacterium]|jgi:NAD(P)-dependent dehydrogenase (short-subunit alcohol dehydrogenase family)
MRVLVVGATGTIGSAVADALEARSHEVVRASSSHGNPRVDIGTPASIDALYGRIGPLDAVVCAAGIAQFGALEDLDDQDFETSIENKLMGQVNLVRKGLAVVAAGGSFTLTSGGLSQNPDEGTVAVSMVGAAVEAFARAAALDLAGRYRVNVVSPGWVAESRVKAGLDPMPGIWAKDLAEYYVDLVEGDRTGNVVSAEKAKA